MTMTIDDVIAEMPKDGWELVEGRYLRRSHCCPITSGPCGCVGADLSRAETIGVLAGLSKDDTLRVMATADKVTISSHYDPALRARLLAAVGLKEPT